MGLLGWKFNCVCVGVELVSSMCSLVCTNKPWNREVLYEHEANILSGGKTVYVVFKYLSRSPPIGKGVGRAESRRKKRMERL